MLNIFIIRVFIHLVKKHIKTFPITRLLIPDRKYFFYTNTSFTLASET
jgi:hypothetical protein